MSPSPTLSTRALSIVLALSLSCLTAGVLPAQFHSADLPADSPAWWTLTDELGAAELRAALTQPEANLDRYLRDLDADLAPRLTERRAEELTFYVNAQLNPELVPLWFAFDILARVRIEREGSEVVENHLKQLGLSEHGTETVLEIAARHAGEVERKIALLRPLDVEFAAFQKRTLESQGSTYETYRSFREAMAKSDVELLAELGSESEARVGELLTAAMATPLLDTTMETLPELRSNLATSDWAVLRRYLLTEVATRIGAPPGFLGDH